MLRSLLLPLMLAAGPIPAAPPHAHPAPLEARVQDLDDELEVLLAEERAEADRLRRRGDTSSARRILTEHLNDEPADALSRALRALCWRDECRWDAALGDAHRAWKDALEEPEWLGPAGLARVARIRADLLTDTGRAGEAVELLTGRAGLLDPTTRGADAWCLGRALLELGRREQAREILNLGARGPADQHWQGLWGMARCQRELGWLELAVQTLVRADFLAQGGEGEEPDLLASLADCYFEASREVSDSPNPPPGPVYKQALRLNPTHQASLVGLFEVHRHNPYLQSRTAGEILEELLSARPDSIPGQLAALSSDLDDGMLVNARKRLARLEELAGGLRAVRTERATLHWIQHERDECRAILDELAASDPADSRPERELGNHLNRLYRFSEAAPFLESAVERDPSDYLAWTELGHSLANTGREAQAREAFERAVTEARGRRDAWRENLELVLRRTETAHTEHDAGELRFSWQPDAAAVLEVYLVPFYEEAREEFARRYGHTPSETTIEVFRKHEDFSVRSTGFVGFPALGVCFGPVVTAVSPLHQIAVDENGDPVFMRGQFNWAETAWHEFSHVIHLGLSHNRCPRWITEGLATWEETHRNPTWNRNMRRDLLDARANENIIRVRDLNRAFRTQRILFAYYQGGLLCRMLIERHGFPPMIRFLEAFDRGLDLDQALAEVFGTTPEELDAEFLTYVDLELAPLHEEPRWNPRRAAYLRLGLERRPPEDAERREQWIEDWLTLAWAGFQQGQRVDAETALGVLLEAGVARPRMDLLRGFLALRTRRNEEGRFFLETALEEGGESYSARMALAALAREREDWEEVEVQLLAAEAAFPGFPDPELSAELGLAAFYELRGRVDEAMGARERWLAWNAGDYSTRFQVARWHAEHGRPAEAEVLYAEANQVDPFRRILHLFWGQALMELGRYGEALREFEVALAVPPELDGDAQGQPAEGAVRANMLGWLAQALARLGRVEEARAAIDEALELNEDCPSALEAAELVS